MMKVVNLNNIFSGGFGIAGHKVDKSGVIPQDVSPTNKRRLPAGLRGTHTHMHACHDHLFLSLRP